MSFDKSSWHRIDAKVYVCTKENIVQCTGFMQEYVDSIMDNAGLGGYVDRMIGLRP